MLKIVLKIFLRTEYNTERFKEEGEGTTRVFRGNFREFTAHLYLYCAVLSHLSHVLFFATLWIIACQAPLSMGFSRQKSWSGLPCPPPGDLLTQGLNLCLLHCRQILYHLSQQGSPDTYMLLLLSRFSHV